MANNRQLPLWLLFSWLVAAFSIEAQTSWKGTSSTTWSNSANWTAGVPNSNTDAIIGDASFTGSNQPNISSISSTATCRNLTLGAGSKASTLTVARSLTVYGNVTIGGLGKINHTGSSAISVRGNWTNSGNYSGTRTSSLVNFSGAAQTIGGSVAPGFRRVSINAGSVTTLAANVVVTNLLSVTGTLDPGAGSGFVVSGVGQLTVNSGGKLLVRAPTLAGNYSHTGVTLFSGGSTVDYAGGGDQSVTVAWSYSTLRISGSGVKTLAGHLNTLRSNTSTEGNLVVAAGTLDLAGFRADRGVSVTGGSVTVAAGATLKIGGTESFPANYATHSLVLTSTVIYGGANQTVTAEVYGNLILSGSSGVVTKIMPTAAFTVAGNLTASQGTATSVTFTAGSAVTVNGSVALGAATTFNGGSFAHSVGGNWSNSGTFNGGTGTVTLRGVNAVLTGPGLNNFSNLVITGSGSTATAGTSLNMAGNLSTSGAGSFTHLTGDTGTVTLTGAAKTLSGSGFSFSRLSVSGSISTSASFTVADDLTVTGSLIASGGTVSLTGAGKRIIVPGTLAFYAVLIPGSITTTSSFSATGDFSVSGSFEATAGTITAAGAGIFSGTVSLFNVTLNGTVHMAAGSRIRVAGSATVISGTFDVTSSPPNTIVYSGSGNQAVFPITYDNLEIGPGGIKTAAGGVLVRGNLTVAPGAVFHGGTGGFVHSVRHDWLNFGTFTAGNSTVELVGPNNATMVGSATFNQLRINKDVASQVVTLNASQSVGTLDMANGTLNTGVNTLTLTTTRTGGGSIFGIITRQHSFSPGVSYAFESPYNTVTFASLTGVSRVTVAVATGTVGDFPSGGAINRQYTLSLTSAGVYSATFRAHYEDSELNGNVETGMALWRNNGSAWVVSGKTGNDSVTNWVEQSGLTDLTGRWTLSDDSSVVRWSGSVSPAWETAANWTVVAGLPSVPPGASDIAELGTSGAGFQPTVSSAVVVKGISFGSAQAMTVTLGSGGSLRTIGNVAGNWSGNAAHTLNVGAESLTVGNDLTLSDGTTGHVIHVNVSSGTVAVTGALTETGGANITFTGAGALNLGGNFNYTSGTFTPGTATTYYTGAGAQAVGGVAYNHLTFNKPAGVASLSSPASVAGNLTLTNGGALRLNATLAVVGNVEIQAGTTLNLAGFSLHVGGNWQRGGVLDISTGGEVLFNGAGTQAIGATEFPDFDINKPSGVAVLSGNVSASLDAEVLAGTLDLATFTINASSSGAELRLHAGTLLRTAGTVPVNFATITFDPTSTVEYYSADSQTVAAVTYGHLSLTNGVSNPKTLAGNLTVAGNLLIATNATFAARTNSLTLQGDWTNAGVFDGGTGTVTLAGSAKTVTGATTFHHLTVTGSYGVANNINLHFTGNVSVLGSFAGGGGTFTFDGDFLNAGTLSSGGTIIFSGTRPQTIQSISAIQASPNSVVFFNGTVPPVLYSTVSPQFFTVFINNTGGFIAGGGWTVFGGFTVGPGASFNGSVFTHTFRGPVVNNGAMTSAGTFNFNPLSPATLALGNTFSSVGIVTFSGTNQTTISSGPLALGSVEIANTHAAGITPGSNWTLSGDLAIATGATWHAGAGLTHSLAGNVDADGNLFGDTSLVIFNGVSEMGGPGVLLFHHLEVSGSLVNLVDIGLTGNFTNNGSFEATGVEVVFTGGTPAVIAGSTTPTPIDVLVIAKSATTVTLGVNVSAVTSLTIASGTLDTSIFSVAEGTAEGDLTVAPDATLRLGGGNPFPVFTGNISLDPASTVDYAGTATQTVTAKAYGNLTSSSTGARILAAGGTIGVAGTFAPGANSYTKTGSTLDFNGAGAQTIPAFAYQNLTSSSTGARTLSATGNIGIAGSFTPGSSSYTVTGSTVVFNGTAQTLPAFTFFNLTTGGSGAKTLGGHLEVDGALTLGAGSFADGGFTVTSKGSVANAVTHTGTGRIRLTGGAVAHELSGAGIYQNLQLDDPLGAVLSLTNLTVNGTLTLANGLITTTTNIVIIGGAGTVVRTGGFVAGFLQKAVPTGSPALTFEVGGATVYAPAVLTFANVTAPGSLLVKSYDGDNPSLASSGFSPNRTLNRYWALTNGGTVFSNYQATFNYSPADLDPGLAGTNLIGRRFSGGGWSNLTTGIRTTTNVQTLNNAQFGQFAFGADGATQLGLQTPPSAIVTAGLPFPVQPVIRIQNDLGELATTDNTTVVTVARGAGTGTLQGTLTATAVNGVATFVNLSHPTAGSITLLFTATDQTGTNSGPITVNAGALDHFAFGPLTSQSVGAPFNVGLTAQDANNNTVTGFAGTVNLTTTAGTILPAVSGAFTAGLLTQSVTVTQAGAGKTVTATRTGGSESGTSAGFTVNPGAITHYLVTAPSTQTAGANFTVTVTALDLNNNTVTTDSSTVVTMTGSGSLQFDGNSDGTFGGAADENTRTLENGTFTIRARDNVAQSVTITATDAGSRTGTSSLIVVQAGAFARLQLLLPGETAAPGSVTGKTGTPTAQTAGAAFPVTVHSVDAQGNPVSATDTVAITSSQSGATLPANAALVAGTQTFSLTLNTPGTATVTASDVTQVGITADTSPLVTVNPASGNWNVDASGNWSTPAHWSSNPLVPGFAPGDVVGLTFNISAPRTVTLDTTSRTVGTLNLGDPDAPSFAFTLAASGGTGLTFNNNGSPANLVQTATTAADVISAPLTLADNLIVQTTSALTLSGVVSGAGSLTKSGLGSLTLTSPNTYSGGTVVGAGTLTLGTSNVLNDAGPLILNGGTFSTAGHHETLGVLTNRSGSTIHLGTNTTGVLTFAGGSYTAGTLAIQNWTGNPGASGTGDRIFFTAGPSATFLTNIFFLAYAPGAIRLGSGEIVPSGAAPFNPDYGALTPFGVLAATTVTSAGLTTINGDLGVSPGTAVTGAPIVNGTIHAGDATAATAQGQLAGTYFFVEALPTNTVVSGDLGGQTLTPGIYKSLASLEITSGNLTLDAQGDGSATFVFLIGSTLITAANTQLILLNGAQSCNVIWQVGSTVSLGENSVFRGNMLVLTSVAMADGATLDGRALVLNGAVTLINNTITVPPCASLQAISFPSPGDQTYGAPPLTLSATASSGLPVSYEVISGPASVVGDQLTITGAGLVTIQATQLGDADWRTANPVDQSILVSPKGLTVIADDLSRVYGAPNPALTASYSGFVNGDTVAVLTGAPDLSTSATVGSGVAGSPYPIVVTVGTLSAANYTFLLVNGRLTVTRAATVNVVSTSANPSQTGSTVTFTATLTVVAPGSGTPTGNVQFLVTGAALGAPVPLVGGVASVGTAALASGTYPVTAEYGGDANFAGATSPLIPDQVVHAGPTTVDYVLPRFPTVGAKVRIATLLANDFDPDDTISLQSVSPTSAQGGTVIVNGLWILYTPPAGFTNADSFTYVVVDTFGFVATGNVLIPIFVDLAQSANVVATEPVGDGDFRTRFLGVPNRAYTVQFAEDLEIPNWTTLGTATAEFLGAFEFTDSPPAISPPRYYRSTYP